MKKLSLHVLKKIFYPLYENNSNINIEALNQGFDHVCVFDSNTEINDKKQIRSSTLIAIGRTDYITCTDPKTALKSLQHFCDSTKGWIFGYLTYDLKNSIEDLSSNNIDRLEFPLLHFFSPKVVIETTENECCVFFDNRLVSETEANLIYQQATSDKIESSQQILQTSNQEIQASITKETYINSVNKLKSHIQQGAIYEIN
ncbi:MAG: hypothetical protein H0X46_07745, partial [Bacteroidetes bacterium]|nr:hypothetical protein [Bacteroidota bacterium]